MQQMCKTKNPRVIAYTFEVLERLHPFHVRIIPFFMEFMGQVYILSHLSNEETRQFLFEHRIPYTAAVSYQKSQDEFERGRMINEYCENKKVQVLFSDLDLEDHLGDQFEFVHLQKPLETETTNVPDYETDHSDP